MRRRGEGGFTLIEVIVVLVIAGMVLGLIVARGPSRSHGLEARAVADRIAGALRLARAQAIAADRPVFLTYDAGARAIAVDGAAPFVLPPELAVAMTTVLGQRNGTRVGRIGFAPDGSATGGRIVVAFAGRGYSVGVDWLTGRVSVADAP